MAQNIGGPCWKFLIPNEHNWDIEKERLSRRAAFWTGYFLMFIGLIHVARSAPERFRDAVRGCAYAGVTYFAIIALVVFGYSVYLQKIIGDLGI